MIYRAVYLQERCQKAIERMLSMGRPASIQVDMEVLELGPRGSALVWAAGPEAQGGRIEQCRLSAAQWAECMLCLEAGQRPLLSMTWHVLDQLPDGRWGVSGDGCINMAPLPARSWGRLQDMLGMA